MTIRYSTRKLEKYFSDYRILRKKLPEEWVRNVKKTMDRLEASDCFGTFLSLGLGRPERLTVETGSIRYSIHVSANARLIIELNATNDTITVCSEIEVEGVCDYHGTKENWYIP